MEALAPMLVSIAFFGLIGFIVHAIVRSRRQREQLHVFTEFHSRLIDRLGSAREFGEFLQTEGGRRFLESLSVESGGGPKVRILRAVQSGIVLTSLGVGLLGLGATFNEDEGLFTVFGVVSVALGIGFILAAAASYVLSRNLGLMDGRSFEPPDKLPA